MGGGELWGWDEKERVEKWREEKEFSPSFPIPLPGMGREGRSFFLPPRNFPRKKY